MNEHLVKIYQMVGVYSFSYTMNLYNFKYSLTVKNKQTNKMKDTDKK